MSVLYPIGYDTERVTLAELRKRHERRMEPEYARRLFAWIESKGGVIGIGGGWRTTPHPVSAASRAGRSFHQTQRFRDGFEGYSAVDLVGYNPNGKHRGVTWDEVPRQGSARTQEYGLHCNVPREPWHIQPVEYDGWWNWQADGRHRPHPGWPLPGALPAPPTVPLFRPEQGEFSLWPLNKNKVRLAQEDFVINRLARGFDNWTDRGDAVRYLQGVILHKAGGRITVDGYYGPLTEGRVMDVQRWWNHHSEYKLEVDGLVGPNTWNIIDWLAGL